MLKPGQHANAQTGDEDKGQGCNGRVGADVTIPRLQAPEREEGGIEAEKAY